MEKEEIVNPGEILAARCTYDSRGHSTMTKIGHTGGDEMCNLYLMFYTLSSEDSDGNEIFEGFTSYQIGP